MDRGPGAGAGRRPDAAGRAAARPAAPLQPRYWSDLFGLRIQVCGRLDGADDVEVTELRPGRRDIARGGMVAVHLRDGVARGVVAVNAPRQFTTLAREMRAAGPVARPRVSLPAAQTSHQRRLSLVG
ncbi:oxidoreductase C-terminal domain-containing protein [Catellatospora bangladeshensis]|uniref:oxidoreductase C-terminal domain-containing protein n=1 Tax=Catellatospora bangladeshensis TaxID=310355 RepID=UPI00361D79FC